MRGSRGNNTPIADDSDLMVPPTAAFPRSDVTTIGPKSNRGVTACVTNNCHVSECDSMDTNTANIDSCAGGEEGSGVGSVGRGEGDGGGVINTHAAPAAATISARLASQHGMTSPPSAHRTAPASTLATFHPQLNVFMAAGRACAVVHSVMYAIMTVPLPARMPPMHRHSRR